MSKMRSMFILFSLVFTVLILGAVSAAPVISHVYTSPAYPNPKTSPTTILVYATIVDSSGGTIQNYPTLSWQEKYPNGSVLTSGKGPGIMNDSGIKGLYYAGITAPEIDNNTIYYKITAINSSGISNYTSYHDQPLFTFDGSAPIVNVSGAPTNFLVTQKGVTASVSCSDNGGSGCNKSTYALVPVSSASDDCASQDYSTASKTLTVTTYGYVCARAVDNAGNIGYSKPMEFNVFNSIQAAIDAAQPNQIINVTSGTYTEAFTISKPLTIIGTWTTVIDATSLTSGATGSSPSSVIYIPSDNVTLERFTIRGDTSNAAISRAIKVTGDNITLDHIMIDDMHGSGIDLNTANNVKLSTVQSINNLKGFGIEAVDSSNLSFVNISVNNNGWGGVTLQTYKKNSSNVSFSGTFVAITDYPLLIEQDPNSTGAYHSITNVNLPSQYQYTAYGFRSQEYKNGNWVTDNYKQWYYFNDINSAKSVAQGLATTTSFTYSGVVCYDNSTGNYYVEQGMKIQDAINAASAGNKVNVDKGTYNENQILINKPLSVLGAGIGQSIINGGSSTSLPVAGLVRITTNSGDVTFSGFTIQNAGTTDSSVSDSSNLFGIYASSNLSGITYNISNNKIIGTNDPNMVNDYGLYADRGNEKLIFTHNIITETGANPILVEQNPGATDISYNSLNAGVYGADSIFYMAYNDLIVSTLQNVSFNTFDMGTGGPFDYNHRATGVSFNSPYPYFKTSSEGGFTNMLISGNTFNNLVDNRRAIGFWNAGSGDNLQSPQIINNTINGVSGSTGNYGIDFFGLTTHPNITENNINNMDTAIYLRDGDAPGTLIHLNTIENNVMGINYSISSSFVNATDNWWNYVDKFDISKLISGNVSYTPWAYDPSFDVYHTLPVISILSPLNNGIYNYLVDELNFSVKEPSTLFACWYSDGTSSNISVPCNQNTTGPSSLMSTEGINNWTLYAVDNSGNLNSATVHFMMDTIAPFVNITSNSSTDAMAYFNIMANATDFGGSGIKNVTLTMKDQSGNIILNNVSMGLGEGNYEHNISMWNLPAGDYDINVYAEDNAGNWNVSSQTLSIIPNVAPSNIMSIKNQVPLTGGTVSFKFNVTIRGSNKIRFGMGDLAGLSPSELHAVISNGTTNVSVGDLNYVGAGVLTLSNTSNEPNTQGSFTLYLDIPKNLPPQSYPVNYKIGVV